MTPPPLMPALLLASLVLLPACVPSWAGGNHGPGDHGHEDGAHEDGTHEDDAVPSVARTRWADGHELFVELDAPVAGHALAYHAHVTRTADNHPATAGRLTMTFVQDGFPVETHTDEAVARPGIFAAEAPAPGSSGVYSLRFTYVLGETRVEWEAGTVEVGAEAPVAPVEEPEGEIAFLKEAQWQVPFQVVPAEEQALSASIEAAGVAVPDPGATAIVAAPVEGLVAWADGLPVVGREVTAGERLATLVPAGAAEHWAGLQAELATARVDRDLAADQRARVAALAAEGRTSERRVAEAEAAVARAEARVEAAGRRLSALQSGSTGAVPIRAPAAGLVVDVGARHGAAVPAGTPLVTVATGDGVLVEARVYQPPTRMLTPITHLSARTGGAERVDLLAAGGQVLTQQLVVDPDTLSAPLAVRVPGAAAAGLHPGDLVSLDVGVGTATPRVVVPRSAVVEVNSQPVVFVQRTGESFTRRRVVLGDGNATHVAVLEGIDPGEQVVVQGGFDVHVASLTGAMESHRH